MARKPQSRELTTRDRILGLSLALPFVAAGVYPIGIGLQWFPIDPAKVHVPGWVMVIIGLVFLSGGLAIAAMVLRPKSDPMKIAMVVWILGLSAVTHWVAFGEGGRQFFHARRINGVLVDTGPVSEAQGRRTFAIGAVALDIGIAAMVVLAIRKRRRTSRARGKAEP